MKIKFYFITFLLAAIVMVILFKKPILIKAQTEPVKQEQVWQCLTSNHKSVHDYTAEAEGNGFPTDRDIYLVTCVGINTRRNQECTTGNAEYDQLLGLNGHADYIQILSQNPPGKTRTSDGNVKLSVKDVGYFHTGTLAFFGVTFGLPSQGLGTGGVEGEENTQQQGTVVFPSLTPIEEIEKCTVIGWDPFGRVFDTKTLEPISNINVTLLDSDKKKYSSVLVPNNPFLTKDDGAFSFLVEQGIYYLTVSLPAGYKFTANPSISPNYQSAYFNLYKPNESIPELIDTPEEVQQGKPNPEHRDIPLDPGTNPGFRSCPSVISSSTERIGGNTRIYGKVSHPLTMVSTSQGDKELKRVQADKFGFYQIVIDNKTILANTPISVKFTKVDLTGAGLTFPECDLVTPSPEAYTKKTNNLLFNLISHFLTVSAQSTIRIPNPKQRSITVDPILTYVEGYVYDGSGKIIPQAKVVVKMISSNIVYYEGRADEKGFFAIDSKYLPIFPYYLEFANPLGNSSVKMTTSQFVEKNQDYLTSNKINLTSTVKNVQAAEKPSPSISVSLFPTMISKVGNSVNEKKSEIVVFIVLTLIVLVAVSIFIFLKIKKRQPAS